ncbi:MAG TPA: radical SAM protein [Candidatus Acidoferrales bacterium]|jgi:radical SAM protein with 4Fe4S-binding SPASM domain|nr:radical SAM protein [Candidatus Acidoferrales bacterium]
MSLMQELNSKARRLGIPLSVHLDITYRCNERCEHCYLDHEDHGEMTTAEIKGILRQLAEAGVFFLTLSGGEALMRRDCFEIIEYARSLMFNVKLKTNAVLIRQKEAERLRALGVEQVQISVYSHRPEVHDAITKIPGSLKRTLAAIRLLRTHGMRVNMANVLMRSNRADTESTRALAMELGAYYTLDPTITPMIDGNTSVLRHRVDSGELSTYFHDHNLVGDVDTYCAPPVPVDEEVLESLPCSAGHTSCYISPYGDLYPCVQFPITCGNVRRQKFIDIWRDSPQLNEVRSIRLKHLTTCSSCTHAGSCTRCPGLAYMEGNMRGPSSADCEKSFVRTGIVTAGMMAKEGRSAGASGLVQIEL